MENDKLALTELYSHLSGAKQKLGHPKMEKEEVMREDLKENGASWDRVKSVETLKRLRLERSVHRCVGTRQLFRFFFGF